MLIRSIHLIRVPITFRVICEKYKIIPRPAFYRYLHRMKPRWKKYRRWLIIILVLYIAVGVSLYFLQERFLFHPEKLPADYKYQFGIPFRQIDLPVNENKNLSIVQFTVPDSIRRGIVLYFHGNRKNINRYAPAAPGFTKHGYEVWMLDYPGFGKSTGDRTEAIMYNDAKILYQMARTAAGADSIIIYGKSIGTGVASYLASATDCQRLILETPYYSIDALAKHYFPVYPVMPMTKFSFPSYQYFEFITEPVTLFHGTSDEIIPYNHSRRLLKKLRTGQGELITIDKGKHNNLTEYALFHQKLDSLLKL